MGSESPQTMIRITILARSTENVLFSPTRRVDRHPCKIAVQDNIAMQVRFKNMVLFNIKIYFRYSSPQQNHQDQEQ
jgi:hypothetical protein